MEELYLKVTYKDGEYNGRGETDEVIIGSLENELYALESDDVLSDYSVEKHEPFTIIKEAIHLGDGHIGITDDGLTINNDGYLFKEEPRHFKEHYAFKFELGKNYRITIEEVE